MSKTFQEKFNERLRKPVSKHETRAAQPAHSTKVSPNKPTLLYLLSAISLLVNVLTFPLSYTAVKFMGSPEYAVWLARNRTNVPLDKGMIIRHEQYYRNVEKVIKDDK